jgi:hypothetical protein
VREKGAGGDKKKKKKKEEWARAKARAQLAPAFAI